MSAHVLIMRSYNNAYINWGDYGEVLVQMIFLVQVAPRIPGYAIYINTLIKNNYLYVLSLQWYQKDHLMKPIYNSHASNASAARFWPFPRLKYLPGNACTIYFGVIYYFNPQIFAGIAW